jgi:exodeoxyribonuclease III
VSDQVRPTSLRVISWNVNGIRACVRKGFVDWLQRSRLTVVGLQEVRALDAEVPDALRALRGWHLYVSPAARRGYSGVALLSRRPFDAMHTTLREPRFDIEGRIPFARCGRLHIVNVYFPKGSGTARDNSRVPYKLDFYRRVFDAIEPWQRRGERVLVLGDFNTAHEPIDLARPKANVENSGFLPAERAELSRWVAAGWVDTFRHFEPRPGHYTWWSNLPGARQRNIGWRIDYVLASRAAMPYVQRAFIQPHTAGSDHCPVGVDIDAAVLA